MENTVALINQALMKLIGAHRRLLEVVREEKTCLAQADLSKIQAVTRTKEGLIAEIDQLEASRRKGVEELAAEWKKPAKELTLNQIILKVQGTHLKIADQLRSNLNLLALLIQRITEQNQHNQGLVERALGYIKQMNKNVLEEKVAKTTTYTQFGNKIIRHPPSRLISKEI